MSKREKFLEQTLRDLILDRPCPCCETTQAPHDEECSFAEDDFRADEELTWLWERDAQIRKALG